MNRSTTLLLGLLLVLGAIVYFILPAENEREVSYKPTPVSISMDSATLARIEIVKKEKSITLENIAGKWMLTSPIRYPVDQWAISQLTSALGRFKLGSLISSNPEKQSLFQVDTTGTRLVVTDRSGKSVSLIVGKMGPSFSEVYVRVPDSKDVYLAEGLDSWTLNKEVRDWRDKTILTTPSESIKKLSYTIGAKEYKFEQDTSGWQSSDQTVDPTAVNSVLSTLSNLRTDDFIDTVTNIQTEPITVAIHGTDDHRLKLFPVLPDSSKYIAQTGGGSQLFTLNKWTVQQLLRPVQQALPALAKSTTTPKPKRVEERTAPPPVAEKKPESVKPITPTTTAPPTIVKPAETTRREQVTQSRESVPAPTPRQETAKPSATPSQPPVSPQPRVSTTESYEPDEEGTLTVHKVQKGETMTTIAQKYRVTTEQILKWNLLKSIAIKPGQELYIYVRK